jgi:parallel beta-helix repeat protein
LITAAGAEFGRPDHGFLMTPTGSQGGGVGIFANATNVKIRGNQVIASSLHTGARGIETSAATQTILIESNQVIGWSDIGIIINGNGKTVSLNHVSMNNAGITCVVSTTAVTGNVVADNVTSGINLFEDASDVTGNAIHGNQSGIAILDSAGPIHKNNIFGNGCGLVNDFAAVDATTNYWGASTGPGPDPADQVCNMNGGTATTSPFATKRFAINPAIEP